MFFSADEESLSMVGIIAMEVVHNKLFALT